MDDEFSGSERMHEPPTVDAVVATIDDAELAGWTCLAIQCRCGTVYSPWRLLRRKTKYRRLDEIAARLKCERCGRRPERVWLYWRGGRDATEEMEKTILEAPK